MPSHRTPRRAPRVRSVNLVAYTGKRRRRQTTSVSLGKTLDLSPLGVRIQVSTELRKGDLLDLEIGAGETLIRAEARVIHVPSRDVEGSLSFDLVEGGFFEVGAEFTSLADRDRAVLLSLLG